MAPKSWLSPPQSSFRPDSWVLRQRCTKHLIRVGNESRELMILFFLPLTILYLNLCSFFWTHSCYAAWASPPRCSVQAYPAVMLCKHSAQGFCKVAPSCAPALGEPHLLSPRTETRWYTTGVGCELAGRTRTFPEGDVFARSSWNVKKLSVQGLEGDDLPCHLTPGNPKSQEKDFTVALWLQEGQLSCCCTLGRKRKFDSTSEQVWGNILNFFLLKRLLNEAMGTHRSLSTLHGLTMPTHPGSEVQNKASFLAQKRDCLDCKTLSWSTKSLVKSLWAPSCLWKNNPAPPEKVDFQDNSQESVS